MGLPNIPGWDAHHFESGGGNFILLPPGGGTNAVRLKLLDGVTVVFDQTFPY
jgi:hypothetical protein